MEVKEKNIEQKLEELIKLNREQNDTLKEIAEFLSNKSETTKNVVNKSDGPLEEIKKEYESIGTRIKELESFAAMYNCWGYHD